MNHETDRMFRNVPSASIAWLQGLLESFGGSSPRPVCHTTASVQPSQENSTVNVHKNFLENLATEILTNSVCREQIIPTSSMKVPYISRVIATFILFDENLLLNRPVHSLTLSLIK